MSCQLGLGDPVHHLVFVRIKALVAVALLSAAQGAIAADFQFDTVKTGRLSGKLIVQWLEPDLFLFIPDSDKPLTFTRDNGQAITPGRMLTDGGSIPRSVWILRNYSPWGFAPAFIVHDWIFEMKHCKIDGYELFSLKEAGLVMAEIMKTMIEQKKVDAGAFTVTSMYLAVVTPLARQYWDQGKCNPPPVGMFGGKPLREYELNF